VKPPNGVAMRVSNEDRLALRDLVHPSWTTSDQVFRPPAVFYGVGSTGLYVSTGVLASAGRKTRIVALDQSTLATSAAWLDTWVGGRCERSRCPRPNRRLCRPILPKSYRWYYVPHVCRGAQRLGVLVMSQKVTFL